MSRTLKRILIAIGAVVGLLVLVAAVALLFVDIDRYKPRLESAASDALGMDVRIGRLGVGLFPGLHVSAEDGRVLGDGEVVVASAKKVRFRIALLPLLRKELRLRRIELAEPRLTIERNPDGALNVERLKKATALLAALDGARLSVSDGTLVYADRKSGEEFEAAGCDLDVSRIRLAQGEGPEIWKGASLDVELACEAIRSKALVVSALALSGGGKDGVFEFESVTMRLLGGQAAATLWADVSGPVPSFRVHYSLPQFRIEDFLAILSPKKAAEGAMDFSATLSMQGTSRSEMVRSAAGEISLRGENLTLVDNDLDHVISRFESSQSFNLVDVGAVFFAGPLGLAVTKGYSFGSLFGGSGGNSRIGTLVSDWRVEHGVAHATDVAMATSENRIALQGGLDLVGERFADVTVAVIDARGCAKVRQAIRGSFAQPVVEKPRVLMSLAGPVIKLLKQTRGLFPTGPCEVFYSGSVAAPK